MEAADEAVWIRVSNNGQTLPGATGRQQTFTSTELLLSPPPSSTAHPFTIKNAERIILSEVRQYHGVDTLATGSLSQMTNFQEQDQTPSLPAGICSSETSSRTSKGQQSGTETIRGKSCAKASGLGNGGRLPKFNGCRSPVRFSSLRPVILFQHRH
jgi:hypothetical protein